MKSSQSTKQLGEDLDSFTWDSPAIRSPTGKRKKNLKSKSNSLRTSMSAQTLSTTTSNNNMHHQSSNNIRNIQQNNFMSGSAASTSSLQRPMHASRTNLNTNNSSSSSKSSTKEDSDQIPQLSLPPKVFVPHNTRPGWTPRAVVVRRLQQSYSAMSLTALLTERDTIDINDLYGELLKNTIGTKMNTDEDEEEDDDTTTNNGKKGTFEFGSTLGTNLIKMLPITMFDNNDYESYDINTWIEYNATGRALKLNENNDYEWCKCKIMKINAEDQERLHIQWLDTGMNSDNQAIIHRLGLCFDAEDPMLFVNRLEYCVKTRKMAESCIRYNLYVDCMPADELGGLDAEQVNRVLSRAMSTNEMRENEFDTSTLLNEINVDYSRTMNKIIFDANMSIPENKHISETLTLPVKESNSNEIPQKGVVHVTQYDLEERFKSFVFGTFLVQPEVVYVLERVQQQCNKILTVSFFFCDEIRFFFILSNFFFFFFIHFFLYFLLFILFKHFNFHYR